ncbi:VOC family protein [Phycicoccus sp. BSK3Z-2]|uniref:VOC family protein n=1 Tax=Phycicoccus avicenniae TaxID=2828860 RepID=A0A941D7J0_9MICO|nr:VOC family protein [Phycicoccus avicenniae]MBR7743529.1 VOC family protein [Phycicoccus avicenniae]
MERTYPPGVTCWIDAEQPDIEAAQRFYGPLLGWEFTLATPPDAPLRYVVATLDGADAAALAEAPSGPARWSTYVAVSDTDASVERAVALGGTVLEAPTDAGPGGRGAVVLDPESNEIRLWQARRRLGAQVANLPGAWNFSNLRSRDPDRVGSFYEALFGWRLVDQGWATAIQVPGYGDHLESTVDPDIRVRQAQAPEGFADTIGAIVPAEDEEPGWYVVFTVADRDDVVDRVPDLGGTVLLRLETEWTREVVVRDPQGAVFTASQFTPPTSWD